MRVRIGNLTGWDTFATNFPEPPFRAGERLTCFWAKGGAKTRSVMIEWKEQDGARWIALVGLSTEWRHYALAPERFAYWKDNQSRGRGGPGDQFRLESASTLVFGLGTSHTSLPRGPHTFWVDEIGVARAPFELPTSAPRLDLDMIAPDYARHELREAVRARSSSGQMTLPPGLSHDGPIAGESPYPRQRGMGFRRGSPTRWIPLVETFDSSGRLRGAVAAMNVGHQCPQRGAMWAYFGAAIDSKLAQSSAWPRSIATVAKRMCDAPFLLEGGAEYLACFEGERPQLGARAFNPTRSPIDANVSISLRGAGMTFAKSVSVSLPPGQSRTLTLDGPILHATPISVEVELVAGGRAVDRLGHDIHVFPRKEAPDPARCVGVRGGQFWLSHKRWAPFGVNYWCSYMIGRKPFGGRAGRWYDPVTTERELANMQALGMNMVCLQWDPQHWRDLLDFIARAARHNIRLNLFLHGADPLRCNGRPDLSLIRNARLFSSEWVLAYDIAWEPRLGREAQRHKWDDEWARWIRERYGTLKHAEKAWGVACLRRDGKCTGPSDAQLPKDGPWRVMVAAYRRFVDDLVSREYGDIVRQIRAIDPHHLVSCRSGYGGTGPCRPQVFQLDMFGMAKHFDFLSPEGWGMRGEWAELRKCGFTTAYAQFVSRGKPVFWSEYGLNVWDRGAMRPDPATIKAQGQHYRDFYRMILDSGGVGAAPWFWPGGFRVGENSDYGMMHPDGTPRPAALVAKEFAGEFAKGRPVLASNATIDIGRYTHPAGYYHMYHQGKEEYGRVISQGLRPALRTSGTGTTSVDTPLTAVGNVPYQSPCPLQYLNAEFNRVRILKAEGRWGDVRNGDTVPVRMNVPIRAIVSVGNTAEATWIAPRNAKGGPGSVFLEITGAPDGPKRHALPDDVAYLGDAVYHDVIATSAISKPVTIQMRLVADQRAPFGQVFRLRLVPEPW